MLTSITPLGERSRQQRYLVTSTAFVLGTLLGGTTLTVIAYGLGKIVRQAVDLPTDVIVGLSVVGTLGALIVAEPLIHRPLGIRRQVNERWLGHFRGWVYGLGFGYQLGTGVATVVTTPLVFVVVLTVGLAPSFSIALAIGLCFAAGRALIVLPGAWVTTPARLSTVSGKLTALERPVHGAVVLMAASAATYAGIYLLVT